MDPNTPPFGAVLNQYTQSVCSVGTQARKIAELLVSGWQEGKVSTGSEKN